MTGYLNKNKILKKQLIIFNHDKIQHQKIIEYLKKTELNLKTIKKKLQQKIIDDKKMFSFFKQVFLYIYI